MNKRILTIIAIAFLSPVFRAAGQQASPNDTTLKTWSAGLRGVHFFDLPSFRYDSELSQDMKGLNGEKTSFDFGFEVYGEKMFTPLLGLQAAFRYGGMTGANDVEYYENSFYGANIDGVFLLSNLDLFRKNSPWNFYAKAGFGHGMFKAEQFLIEDDAPDNKIEDKYWESHVGGGVQYELNQSWRLELESSYNVVFTDGFDGYDYSTGSDPYISTAIGVAYTFGNKEAKPMYATNYFGENYVATGEAADEEARAKAEANAAAIEEIKKENDDQAAKLGKHSAKLENHEAQINSLLEQMNARSGNVHVYFEFDSSELTREARMRLMENLSEGVNAVELVAYADNNGSSEYNAELKQRRAESVKQFLVDVLKFDENMISVKLAETEDKELENQFLDRKVVVKF